MAQSTLGEMTRQLQAYCDFVPYKLAERWIIDRYRQTCEGNLWSFKIGEGSFSTSGVYETGTVSLVNGDATVTGAATVWTSGMVGLQFWVGGFVFDITAVNTGAQTLEISPAWKDADESGTAYKILTAFINPYDEGMTDFQSWVVAMDPVAGLRLATGSTSADIDMMDPTRSSFGLPAVLAARTYSLSTSGTINSTSVPRYELWPYDADGRQYRCLYERRMIDLSSASDTPAPILRSDVLVKGALADLSRWPGTTDRKNPFYDPYFNQYKAREADYLSEVNKLMVQDQNIYLTDLSHYTSIPYAPLNGRYFQTHAF